MSTIYDNNFIQCIGKATRIHNQSSSLIDHILTNNFENIEKSGVIISDISDHFPVFIELTTHKVKQKTKIEVSRNFSRHSLERFRDNLSHIEWNDVNESNDVDIAYRHFWSSFKTLYDLNVPQKRKKFNKNYHKINGYMTQGLLISRRTKINLLKKSINEPSESNIRNYRNFRNIYTKTLRASRKLYFDSNFQKARKNPKKTWDLIREAIGSDPAKPKIDKLSVSDRSVDDLKQIPNEFNKFFTTAGKNISDSISNTLTEPENFLKADNAPLLEFSLTSPGEIVDIIRAFQSKTSTDIDGMSMKLLKSVAIEISFPLAHIFNLSLKNGTFPSELKLSRVIPIHKGGIPDQLPS